MATAAQLKALRKKYGLGEFRSKKRRARRQATYPARRKSRKKKRSYKQRAKSFRTGFLTGNYLGVHNASAGFKLNEAAYEMARRAATPLEQPPGTYGRVLDPDRDKALP